MNAPADAPPTTVPGARIWILDADPELARILEQRLQTPGWRTRVLAGPSELTAALNQAVPDLLLLGQLPPERSAVQLLADLRRGGHGFAMLLLCAAEDQRARLEALEAGADDALTRPFLIRELMLRIEHLLVRATRQHVRRLAAPAGFQIGALWFDPANRRLQASDGRLHSLSRGETLLLLALCRGGGAVLSREELARQSGSTIAGHGHRSRSIDVRLSKLRRLLRRADPAESWITSVRGRGYRLAVAAWPAGQPQDQRSAAS